tara:strand:- start:568 stop:768 length:201 start_codon:yes stop_codon:yes gene_type:complete
MKLTLSITLGNDAMRTGEDLAAALHDVADKLAALGGEPIDEDRDDFDGSGRIADENGNGVGRWLIV